MENPTKITIQVRSYGIGILFTQLIYHKNQPNLGNYTILGGGFKHFLFSPRGGEDSHVDHQPDKDQPSMIHPSWELHEHHNSASL